MKRRHFLQLATIATISAPCTGSYLEAGEGNPIPPAFPSFHSPPSLPSLPIIYGISEESTCCHFIDGVNTSCITHNMYLEGDANGHSITQYDVWMDSRDEAEKCIEQKQAAWSGQCNFAPVKCVKTGLWGIAWWAKGETVPEWRDRRDNVEVTLEVNNERECCYNLDTALEWVADLRANSYARHLMRPNNNHLFHYVITYNEMTNKYTINEDRKKSSV